MSVPLEASDGERGRSCFLGRAGLRKKGEWLVEVVVPVFTCVGERGREACPHRAEF